MEIRATGRAVEACRRARDERGGEVTITLGTGCCESTAPFLYENHFSGPDHRVVGDVADVAVLAPPMLCDLYADDTLVIDVVDEYADSMSIETDWGIRLVLRGHEDGVGAPACATPAPSLATEGPPTAAERGEPIQLPEHLRDIRIR